MPQPPVPQGTAAAYGSSPLARLTLDLRDEFEDSRGDVIKVLPEKTVAQSEKGSCGIEEIRRLRTLIVCTLGPWITRVSGLR